MKKCQGKPHLPRREPEALLLLHGPGHLKARPVCVLAVPFDSKIIYAKGSPFRSDKKPGHYTQKAVLARFLLAPFSSPWHTNEIPAPKWNGYLIYVYRQGESNPSYQDENLAS